MLNEKDKQRISNTLATMRFASNLQKSARCITPEAEECLRDAAKLADMAIQYDEAALNKLCGEKLSHIVKLQTFQITSK